MTPHARRPSRDEPGALSCRIVVAIPTYNERENLPALVRGILDLGPDYAVIIADDNSPDGTGDVADQLAAEHADRVAVVHRPSKQGIGPAYRAAFALALTTPAEIIAQMDADHSHDPHDLPRLVEALSCADLALGSRYVAGGSTAGWPFYRKLISRLGGLYARLVLSVPVADLTSGFKAYRRQALEAIALDAIRSDGYCFQIETTYRALQRGCRVVEVPITFVDRVAGKSKLSRRIVVEAMVVVWRLRWSALRRRL